MDIGGLSARGGGGEQYERHWFPHLLTGGTVDDIVAPFMALTVLFRKVGELGRVLGVPAMRHRRMVPRQETLGKIDVLVVRARHCAVERLSPISLRSTDSGHIGQLVCVLLLGRFVGHGRWC